MNFKTSPRLYRLVFLAVFTSGILCLICGILFDQSFMISLLVRITGGESILRGRNLYKLSFVQPFLILSGLELVCLSVLGYVHSTKILSSLTSNHFWRNRKTQVFGVFLSVYGVLAVGTLNFYGVYVIKNGIKYHSMTDVQKVRSDFLDSGYGNSYDVIEAVLNEITSDAHIALICPNDIANIIAYYIFPRKVYVRPGAEKIEDIPCTWLDKNRITHLLDVTGFERNPLRIGADSTRFQIIPITTEAPS